jgi:hypothetical protein
VSASGPSGKGFRGVWTVGPALAGIAVHFALREVLNPWLNASSDTKFWGAVTILVIPLVFAIFAMVRAIIPPKRR